MYKASAVIIKLLQNSLKHIYLKDSFEILEFSFKACKLVLFNTFLAVRVCGKMSKAEERKIGPAAAASRTFASTDIKAWLNLQKLRFVCCD